MFKKMLTWLAIFVTFLNPMLGSVTAFAETINESNSTEEVMKTEESKSSEETTSTEATSETIEETTTQETTEDVSPPNVITQEVPEGYEKYFITIEDIQNAASFSEQERLAQESEEWQSMIQNNTQMRSVTLSENGRKTINMTRILPNGTMFTHDYMVRWQIDGEDVFCLQEGTLTSAGISYDAKEISQVITNPTLHKKLSYVGFFGYYTQPTLDNYVLTQMMVWDVMGGSFVNYGTIGESAFTNFVQTVNGKINQFSQKPSFDNQTVTIKVGEEVEVKDTKGYFNAWAGEVRVNTANVEVRKSGNSLFIRATNNSKDGVLSVTPFKSGSPGVGASYAYVNPQAQTLGLLRVDDPNKAGLTIKVLKNGDFKLTKLDAVTGKKVPNVTYEIKRHDTGQTKQYTTDAKGEIALKEIPAFYEKDGKYVQNKLDVKEVKAPAGYILDKQTHTITIEPNKEVTLTAKNDLQQFIPEGKKVKEVYNAEESWNQGKPVYDTVPAENIEFDIIAKTDITAPDKETVLVKKGEILDSVKTDKNGYWKANKKFYNGDQNKYQLIEKNVPDNYRQPSEEQTTFSVAYGDNTTPVLTFELGVIDNLLKTGEVDFNKVDSINQLQLPGAKFLIEGITTHNKDVSFVYETKEEPEKLKLPDGTYKFTEIVFPENYGQASGQTETILVTVKDGEVQPITVKNEEIVVPEEDQPEISTLFVTTTGGKDFNPKKDQELVDKVSQVFPKSAVGTEKYWVTQFHKITADGKVTVLDTVKETRKVTDEKETFDVTFNYKAGMVSDGDTIVATHIVYNDKEQEEEFARHFDLTNKDQTLTAKEPKIETRFVTVNGDQTFDPDKDQELIDHVSQEFPESTVGETKYWVTQFHKIDKNGKETVVGTVETARKVSKASEEFKVSFDYKAGTLKDGEKLVATHIVYKDKDHKEEEARHFDLKNEKQTLTAKGVQKETPTTPVKQTPTSTPKQSLPKTGETVNDALIALGLFLFVGVGAVLVRRKMKQSN
ncbi:SpaA isopeptide-forming pilin-related protein [Enterococcus faecalis]|uniref:SpaA isopeptide-forming pilin-related protein n=1 Tax=Enterococcus faecalis TaxID=1351 RepID=UPI00242B5DAE|nr:SpaA isopeptide-forming pilin-related protein [Enterococcus faecalis]